MMATKVEMLVAIKVLVIMLVGASAPLADRKAIAVAGISCTLEVLMARKVHMALLAS